MAAVRLSAEEEKQLQTLKKEESVGKLRESNPIVYYITKFIDAQLHLNYMRDFMIYNIIEEEIKWNATKNTRNSTSEPRKLHTRKIGTKHTKELHMRLIPCLCRKTPRKSCQKEKDKYLGYMEKHPTIIKYKEQLERFAEPTN